MIIFKALFTADIEEEYTEQKEAKTTHILPLWKHMGEGHVRIN